ncbi:MAG: dihydropteroate synthase [Chitinispirillia bacterium]|nr:dihydropteroate synthase [Chitinispirillia bacterium]
MIFEKPYAVMGIVNVTDDSFYDGGRYFEIDAAVAHALRLVDDGADIIDIGGASSRPGAKLLPAGKEVERVVPVIEALVKRGVCVPVSVDTVWSEVAGAAFVAGAAWVNDISAGRIDPQMPAVAARFGCVAVLTHSRGTPETMQDTLRYGDVVAEVVDELTVSVNRFLSAGVERRKIVLDPGFGFAKGVDHNIALLRGIGEIARLGYPVMAGLSRKSFIGAVTGRGAEDRLPGTLAATAVAYGGGARIFRVHDVRETVDFLKVLNVTGFGDGKREINE